MIETPRSDVTAWAAVGRSAFLDSLAAQSESDEGSSAQLIHTREGDPQLPRETCRLSEAGLVAECENNQSLTLHGRRGTKTRELTSKNLREGMEARLTVLKGEAAHPLAYQQTPLSILLTFAVLDSMCEHRAIELA